MNEKIQWFSISMKKNISSTIFSFLFVNIRIPLRATGRVHRIRNKLPQPIALRFGCNLKRKFLNFGRRKIENLTKKYDFGHLGIKILKNGF